MSYEELKALIDLLLKHVDDLSRSEERIMKNMTKVDNQAAIMSITTYKAWKAVLLRIAKKAKEVYDEASAGNRLAASIDSCSLADMVKNVIMASSADDPIYLGLRPVLSYLQALAMALCRPAAQPTIQP